MDVLLLTPERSNSRGETQLQAWSLSVLSVVARPHGNSMWRGLSSRQVTESYQEVFRDQIPQGLPGGLVFPTVDSHSKFLKASVIAPPAGDLAFYTRACGRHYILKHNCFYLTGVDRVRALRMGLEQSLSFPGLSDIGHFFPPLCFTAPKLLLPQAWISALPL